MRKSLIILLICLVSISCFATRKALVIGNASYPDSPLKNPTADAIAVGSLLKELDFATTILMDLDLASFSKAVDSFTDSLVYDDEVVFYYSGHGVQIDGENYLIPTGKILNDNTDVKYYSLNANLAADKLSRAGLSLMVLDACRDNPYRKVKGGNKGLALMNVQIGNQLIIYSTGSGKTASDGASSKLSPFTDAFVRFAPTPNCTIEEIMRFIVGDVRRTSNNQQIPFYYGSLEYPFYLAKSDNLPSLKPLPEQTRIKAITTENQAVEIPGMIFVQGGTYNMGDFLGIDLTNLPLHEVTVNSFYIGKYEVSQKDFADLNSLRYEEGSLPQKLTWFDAIRYCNRKSEEEGLNPCYSYYGTTDAKKWTTLVLPATEKVLWDRFANGYRLPTEAEWEFAARGGIHSKGYNYSGSHNLAEVAWTRDNATETHPVGTKQANELGIYDMSGNLSEWCWDWFYKKYAGNPEIIPQGEDHMKARVIRGGSISEDMYRVCSRWGAKPDYSWYGLRLVRNKQ